MRYLSAHEGNRCAFAKAFVFGLAFGRPLLIPAGDRQRSRMTPCRQFHSENAKAARLPPESGGRRRRERRPPPLGSPPAADSLGTTFPRRKYCYRRETDTRLPSPSYSGWPSARRCFFSWLQALICRSRTAGARSEGGPGAKNAALKAAALRLDLNAEEGERAAHRQGNKSTDRIVCATNARANAPAFRQKAADAKGAKGGGSPSALRLRRIRSGQHFLVGNVATGGQPTRVRQALRIRVGLRPGAAFFRGSSL